MEGESLGLCAERCIALRHKTQHSIQRISDKNQEFYWNCWFSMLVLLCFIRCICIIQTIMCMYIFNFRKYTHLSAACYCLLRSLLILILKKIFICDHLEEFWGQKGFLHNFSIFVQRPVLTVLYLWIYRKSITFSLNNGRICCFLQFACR